MYMHFNNSEEYHRSVTAERLFKDSPLGYFMGYLFIYQLHKILSNSHIGF